MEVPRAMLQWKSKPFLQKGRRVGGSPGRDRLGPTAERDKEKYLELRNHGEVGQAGAVEDNL